jgi:hypothetical protein
MTKIATLLALTLLSSSAFGFIPKQTALVTTDSIYLKDKRDQYWQTSTDCDYNITKISEVAILPIDKRLQVNSRVMLRVNGQRQVCRITEMSKL